MTVLAHLTDLHLGSPNGDPGRDLAAAVAAVAAVRPRPDAVLVSGDLVDSGRPEDYVPVVAALQDLPMPVHVLPGNHDDRDALRAAFPRPGQEPRSDGAHYRYATRVGSWRLVACDTILPGRDDGAFDLERREWLREQLAAHPGTPTLVAMHHPPIEVGLPGLDVLGMPADDRRELGRLLAGFPQVRAVLAGHVHAATFGRLGSVPVTTCPSAWRVRPEPRLGDPELRMTDQPTGFALHALLGDVLVTHVQPLGG